MPRTSTSLLFDLGSAAVRAVLVPTAVLLSMLAASVLLTSHVNPKHYVEVARHAIDSGTLEKTTTLPLSDGVVQPVFNFNDCLILAMIVAPQRDSILRHSISPIVPLVHGLEGAVVPRGYPPFIQCAILHATLEGQARGQTYYHRYLHGSWLLARGMLSVLSFQSAANVLLAHQLGLLLLLFLAAASGMRSGTAVSRRRAFAFASIALIVAVFHALPVYGRSPSFAPSDIVVLGFVLFWCLKPPSRQTDRGFMTTAALFGALTMACEFLTGATPTGVAVVLAMIVLDPEMKSGDIWRRASLGVLCFIGACGFALVAKMLAVASIWGWREIVSASSQLGSYMTGTIWHVAPETAQRLASYGLDAETIKSSRILVSIYTLLKVGYFSSVAGLGSRWLGLAILVVIPSILALWAIARAIGGPAESRPRELLLLAVATAMPAWYLLLPSHTIIHAFFMVRPLAWIAALLVGCTIVMARAGRPFAATGASRTST